jgi:hypothetical protein
MRFGRLRQILGVVATSAIIASSLVVTAPPLSVLASADDYPSSGPYCQGGATCDLANAPKDSLIDVWGFFNRECTSFAAWRMQRDGHPMTNTMRGGQFGDAWNWYANAIAIGIPTTTTPTGGAVLQSYSVGHVAYTEIAGNPSTVEDYNWTLNGTYREHSWAPTDAKFLIFGTALVAPIVNSISPSNGLAGGGTSASIGGSGFTGISTSASVMFGGAPANGFVRSGDTQITATSPTSDAGTIDVTVTNNGTISSVAAADQFTFGACTSVTLASQPSSPVTAGTPVTFTATVAGCADANPVFQFWVQPTGQGYEVFQAYSSSNSFTWVTWSMPAGSYNIDVWVRDANSSASYDTYAIMAFTLNAGTGGSARCSAVTASASPASPSPAGTVVSVSASASGCTNPRYEFWLLPPGASAYQLVQKYGSNSSFSWNTSGQQSSSAYRVMVWVRDLNSSSTGNAYGAWDTYNNSTLYTVTSTSATCSSVTVSASPASPIQEGTTLTVTAGSSGCSNPIYSFWVLLTGASGYLAGRGYQAVNNFNWHTGGLPPGQYTISVWARDVNSTGLYGNDTGRWDAYNNSTTYSFTACTSETLSATPPSPQARGTTVQVTAQANGCVNPAYAFWVLPPWGAWEQLQAYSATPTLSWNTTGRGAGTYDIRVWARVASPGIYTTDQVETGMSTTTPLTP